MRSALRSTKTWTILAMLCSATGCDPALEGPAPDPWGAPIEEGDTGWEPFEPMDPIDIGPDEPDEEGPLPEGEPEEETATTTPDEAPEEATTAPDEADEDTATTTPDSAEPGE